MFKTLLELTTHFPVVAGEQEKWFGQLHIGIDKKNHHFKWCDGMLASLLNILVTLLLYQRVGRGGPGIGFVGGGGV